MMTKSKAGLAALVLIASGAAQAADLPSSKYLPLAPALAPIFSWTGVYGGVQFGYSWEKDSTKEFFTAGRTFTGVTFDYSTDTALAGIHGGFNYQIGSIVLGVEGDLEAVNARGGFNDPGGRTPFDPGGVGRVQRDWQGAVRGRVGYAFDRFMVYGAGGITFTEFDYWFYNPVVRGGEGTTVTKRGWNAGGGVNYAVTNALILGLDYRYTEFKKFDYVATGAFLGLTGEQSPSSHSVRASFAYKF